MDGQRIQDVIDGVAGGAVTAMRRMAGAGFEVRIAAFDVDVTLGAGGPEVAVLLRLEQSAVVDQRVGEERSPREPELVAVHNGVEA